MKIYFKDGPIDKNEATGLGATRLIDAADGYSENSIGLYLLDNFKNNVVLYTNSLVALTNGYGWNEEKQQYDIYMQGADKDWYLIQDLTPREIKYAHNIMKLFIGGTFTN